MKTETGSAGHNGQVVKDVTVSAAITLGSRVRVSFSGWMYVRVFFYACVTRAVRGLVMGRSPNKATLPIAYMTIGRFIMKKKKK
jgi:hypothetical protein